jgi:hypothetical protein
MVVRMHRAQATAPGAAQFRCAIGQHFVHVHIGLRTRAGLPNGERKFFVVLARQHFIGGFDNSFGDGRFQQTQIAIHQRRRALDLCKGVDQFPRHTLG